MEESLKQRMAADMAEIARMHIPFGKFGPDRFPPAGLPIYDLPAEYLQWFSQRGWPRGNLGRLLQIVHQMKVDGSDACFDPLRKAAGGSRSLRALRRRDFNL